MEIVGLMWETTTSLKSTAGTGFTVGVRESTGCDCLTQQAQGFATWALTDSFLAQHAFGAVIALGIGSV